MTASVHFICQFVCSLVQDKRLSLAKIGKFTQLGLLDSRAKSQTENLDIHNTFHENKAFVEYSLLLVQRHVLQMVHFGEDLFTKKEDFMIN
uniref:Uncharacterized protein n=1 Tax=Solanum lycopersicum TaxID=4081 RepID=A0A3Q7J2L3_SOLLC